MEQQYYRVVLDTSIRDSWFLGEPVDGDGNVVDARKFTEGEVVSVPQHLTLPVNEDGQQVNFLLAAFDMPVVSIAIGQVIERIAPEAVQRFPVTIAGYGQGYEILNATRAMRCVDEAESDFVTFTSTGVRPDLAGQYEHIRVLHVRRDLDLPHIFRVKDYKIALVVSETLKSALEKLNARGIRFRAA